MLAGIVQVNLAGDNLVVSGDYRDNAFTVNLGATSMDELVVGQDETRIRFSRSLRNGFDLSNLRDVRISTGSGNDTVVVNGNNVEIRDDFVVNLGRGEDSLYVVADKSSSFVINDDVRVRGASGDDSVLFSYVTVRDDIRMHLGAGSDVLGLNETSVQDKTLIRGQNNSSDPVLLNAVNLNNQGSRRSTRLQVVTGDPAQVALNQLKDDFFEQSTSIETDVANTLHDGLNDLAGESNLNLISLDLDPQSQTVTVDDPTPSVSVLWDRAVQQAVTETAVGPTIGSRAYAMVHTAIYDAWSAYDQTAISTQLQDTLQRPTGENTDRNKKEAASHAAYRVLQDLFPGQIQIFDQVMDTLGFDPATADGRAHV